MIMIGKNNGYLLKSKNIRMDIIIVFMIIVYDNLTEVQLYI